MNYSIEMQCLENKYDILIQELESTHQQIKDWNTRTYKHTKRIKVHKGEIKRIAEINERYRQKQISDLKDNIKELHKGIDYIHNEMVLLNNDYDKYIKIENLGWSSDDELEWM